MNIPVYKAIDLLKSLTESEQQNWLKEISNQEDPVSYLEGDYDEFIHFLAVFDWDESEMGYSYWEGVAEKYVKMEYVCREC